jgi:hypothetical protein
MRNSCVSRSVSLPLRQESGTNCTAWKNRTVIKLKADSGTKSRAGATCRITVSGLAATVTSTGQQDMPPRTGLPLFCFAGALLPEWRGQFSMPAIRSGWLCSDELWWIEGAPAKAKFAKFGSVHPMRHAKTAIQRESPAATAARNVGNRKRILYSLYPFILQDKQ